MKAILAKPWVWFVPQAVLLLGVYASRDGFQVTEGGDTETFLKVSRLSFGAYLADEEAQIVPYGYPLFLKGVRAVSPFLKWDQGVPPDFQALPRIQLAIHIVAVLVFYAGLRGVLASGWLALLAASTVLYSNMALLYGHLVMSDALGSSLAVAAVGLLLLVVRYPGSPPAWIGLGLGLALAYHVRAAYLFLVPLTPLLGSWLAAVALPRERWAAVRLRLAAGLVAVAVVPLLAYCTARWQVLGRFGFLSMGDYSLFGITGQILTDDVVPELPPDVRPLAKAFVDLRKFYLLRHLKLVPEDAVPPAADEPCDDTGQDPAALPELGPEVEDLIRDHRFLLLAQMSAEIAYLEPGALADLYLFTEELKAQTGIFAYHIMLLSQPSLQKYSERGTLATLNSAVLRSRPREYLRFVGMTLRMGVLAVLLNSYVGHALLAVLAALLLAWHILWLFRRLRPGHERTAGPSGLAQWSANALHIFLPLVGAFALTSLLQLALVTLATPRYTDAAGVFLPALLVPAIFLVWERVRHLLLLLAENQTSAGPGDARP